MEICQGKHDWSLKIATQCRINKNINRILKQWIEYTNACCENFYIATDKSSFEFLSKCQTTFVARRKQTIPLHTCFIFTFLKHIYIYIYIHKNIYILIKSSDKFFESLIFSNNLTLNIWSNLYGNYLFVGRYYRSTLEIERTRKCSIEKNAKFRCMHGICNASHMDGIGIRYRATNKMNKHRPSTINYERHFSIYVSASEPRDWSREPYDTSNRTWPKKEELDQLGEGKKRWIVNEAELPEDELSIEKKRRERKEGNWWGETS